MVQQRIAFFLAWARLALAPELAAIAQRGRGRRDRPAARPRAGDRRGGAAALPRGRVERRHRRGARVAGGADRAGPAALRGMGGARAAKPAGRRRRDLARRGPRGRGGPEARGAPSGRASSRSCAAGTRELERLALALLQHYDRPEAPLPAGPFPVELGPFTLERELGAGAHGKVFLARRRPLDGFVAVKLMRPGPGMSAFVEQVRREAGRARRIPSVHVVPVFDAGRIEGGPFYVEMAVCADPDEASPGSIRIGRSLHEERPALSAPRGGAPRRGPRARGARRAPHRRRPRRPQARERPRHPRRRGG